MAPRGFEDSLLKNLTDYGESDFYPFHMPGHKRRTGEESLAFPNPFSVDITEIEGFDNLHRPEGILRDSMERAAKRYGSDKTYYLVNGSTCGILSAICACVHPGERFLMARNSHKAAYHAALLRRSDPVYVCPRVWEEYGICGGITPASVERILGEQDGIRAVFLTSPTYEGVVSDVRAIADIAHGRGIPLIVDEAHGAHFSFGAGYFPVSALECGADIVIQSLHKTLPALTQTAVLHVKSRLVRPEQVERYLQMFQSSSPSYVLLASVENCIRYMAGEGRTKMEAFGRRLLRWQEEAGPYRRLALLPARAADCGGVARDPSKIVIFAGDGGAGLSGAELARILRERYHLEPEMCCRDYVLLMTSLMDTEEGFERLEKALWEIDRGLDREADRAVAREAARAPDWQTAKETVEKPAPGTDRLREYEPRREWDAKRRPDQTGPEDGEELPTVCMSMCEADQAAKETVELKAAAGRVSGGFLTVYPPGIPAVVPGELITRETAAALWESRAAGLTVEGLTEDGRLRVLRGSPGSREKMNG